MLYAVYARKKEDEAASLDMKLDCLTKEEAGELARKLDAKGYQTIITGSLKEDK